MTGALPVCRGGAGGPGAAACAQDGGDVGTHRYQITVCGGLDETGREVLGDFGIEANGTSTVLTGELDQAALHGALNRIRWLGLELIELRRLAARLRDV